MIMRVVKIEMTRTGNLGRGSKEETKPVYFNETLYNADISAREKHTCKLLGGQYMEYMGSIKVGFSISINIDAETEGKRGTCYIKQQTTCKIT